MARAEMAALRGRIRRAWIEGERGNAETAAEREERHRLTLRWYELRHRLRAS